MPRQISTRVWIRTRRLVRRRSNSAADWQPYGDVLAQIYDIIFDLRDGKPTIVRAMDMYNPVIADWRAAGIEPECTAEWEMMAQTVRDTAAKCDVPTVSMYDAFNGVDHSEDPRLKGYITYDNQHTNDTGKAAMVDVLDSMGYDPIGAERPLTSWRPTTSW